MIERVDVYYEGWGESWLWGTLVTTNALNSRPQIVFEYSNDALQKQYQLSAYTLPIDGPRLRRGFPAHQLGLPGPVYDALPDGWGMMLMDRLFRSRGLSTARIGPLERLTYIANNAMGAMSFKPVMAEGNQPSLNISLDQLAIEVQEVLQGEGRELLQRLLLVGGSPQGARPKALVYRNPLNNEFTTAVTADFDAWLVKFPAQGENAEVCAIEMIYAHCLRLCGIQTPETQYFSLPNGQAAFASKRFDRQNGQRVPMQSLAAFTGADYASPGALDYVNFMRATQLCTNDVREKALAFERAVFNIVFNNRDDHPKNFSYLMTQRGQWQLAPAYDVTFCEGPGGYHQMDVMGEALTISGKAMLRLAQEAEVPADRASRIIDDICQIGSAFSSHACEHLPGAISAETLTLIQNHIDNNIRHLRLN